MIRSLAPSLPDSALALQGHQADSAVGAQLPPADPITPIIQWVFQRSPWIMWGGALLAAGVVFFFLRWFWPRRAGVLAWVRTRSRGLKLALATGFGVAFIGAAGVGYQGYHFVETDKRFCNGCHIFVPSGHAWTLPDTGNYTLVPRLEGKHDTLSCHTCHPLKPTKEAVKLIFWMSGVRGDSIPEHARVPRAICEQCHVQGEAKETWKAIAATAGHRTHLESDSLRGKIECLTCHARTAHRFVPVNETCGQSGCHAESKTRIILGKMTAQGQAASFHCQACHDFVATVPRLATRDSAAGTLRPALQQCFACHAMKARLPDFDIARDPHKGTCGMCHNPHLQDKPLEAKQSCTTAKCHADWRGEPFHVGLRHRDVAQQCITCHPPHAAKVDGSDCAGCHARVHTTRGGGFKPPLPFDTLKALQQSLAPPEQRPQKPKGDGPPPEESSARSSAPFSSLPSDTFPHERHKKLECLTCHFAASGHGRLTFEPPRGCQICHHQAPSRSECATCHQPADLAAPRTVEISVPVPRQTPRVRPVSFPHEKHSKLSCTGCHTTKVTMAPADSAVACKACHSDHHSSGRDCSNCHKTEVITTAHKRPEFTHMACDACHTPASVAKLVPTRSFCLVCHDQAQNHYAPAECSACHFLRPPDDFRQALIQDGAR